MSDLISGKEALIAKLNGSDVQYNLGGLDWSDLTDRELNYWQGERYLKSDLGYKFRLKPKTIKLNNIEVPAPFEPKSGEKVYSLCGFIPEGYESWVVQREVEGRLVWRTEAEVKQVIEALRQVFKV